MKRKQEPLRVESANGGPALIRDGKQVYRVEQILDRWIYQGEWWAEEKRREYFRVLTPRGILELYTTGDSWHLVKVFD
jgi:hypothetical protein